MAPQDPLDREAWAAGYQAGFRDAYKLGNSVKGLTALIRSKTTRKKPRRKK
jgi:hypothetical protein